MKAGLPLADALQLAVASGCDGFLTNDAALGRVQELDIVMIESLEST